MTAAVKTLGVTGTFGYIGRRLLNRLQQADAFERIICTDILPPPDPLPERCAYYHCDIRDLERLSRVVAETGIDVLVHLAYIAEPTRNPRLEYDVDVGGTQNILTLCDRLPIRKLVVASSDCAYGFFPDTPDYLTEAAPLRPTPGFTYAENKVELEKRVQAFAASHSDCSVVVLRPCMVLGPHADNTTSRSMKAPVIMGFKGYNPIMQFIHEDDAAEAFYKALVMPVSGAFNLAADAGMPYRELARQLGKPFLALPAWLVYPLVETLYRIGLMPFGKAQLSYIRYPLSMNIDKIKKEMGFSPRYTSVETVASFLDAAGKKGGRP
jgi:UDP-glucose 4-epimerase